MTTPQHAVTFRYSWAVMAKYSFPPTKVVLGGERKEEVEGEWKENLRDRRPEECTVCIIPGLWLLVISMSVLNYRER